MMKNKHNQKAIAKPSRKRKLTE